MHCNHGSHYYAEFIFPEFLVHLYLVLLRSIIVILTNKACSIQQLRDQLIHVRKLSNFGSKKQELSYRKQIARQLRTQFVEGISVTLKSTLRAT